MVTYVQRQPHTDTVLRMCQTQDIFSLPLISITRIIVVTGIHLISCVDLSFCEHKHDLFQMLDVESTLHTNNIIHSHFTGTIAKLTKDFLYRKYVLRNNQHNLTQEKKEERMEMSERFTMT